MDLEELAREAGTSWAAAALAVHAGSGRAVGGWPGTLSEARTRLEARLREAHGSLVTIEPADAEELARRTNDAARTAWRRGAHREQG